jgi:protein-disulfide isomerase
MHDLLYENQASLREVLLMKLADSLHPSSSQLKTSFADERYHDRARGDFMGGVRSGVNGTPTFFINGERHDGSYEFDSLRDAIEGALK